MRIQTPSFDRSIRAVARYAAGAALALAVAFGAGCTSQQVDGGASPAYLVIDSLTASSGDEPQQFSGTLRSDVRGTCGGLWPDNLRVNMRIAMKDPGTSSSPNEPTSTNWITVTRYAVRYIRADGRNVQGVDVPYAFDGGMTLTATATGGEQIVTLVRVQSKIEAPLTTFAANLNSLATIAEVTFYGHDQAGRSVSATGTINVEFANFADDDTDCLDDGGGRQGR